MLAFTFVDFLDELTSGVPVLQAPDIRAELAFAYFGTAGVLLVLPMALGAVEAPLLLLSDRWSRQRGVAIGLALQALFTLAAAASSSALGLGIALAAWGSAGGLTSAFAQGALVETFTRERERMMTRWALMGTLGDLLTPAFLALVAAFGGSWRAALVVVALLLAAHAVVVSLIPLRAEVPEPVAVPDVEEAPEPLRVALRAGLAKRCLLVWLGASALCALMDEILVAFGSLLLREKLGATPGEQAVAFTALSAGAIAGLLVSERLLARFSPLHVLAGSTLACMAAFVAWLLAGSIHASIPLLALVGAGVAPLYPIATAQAYAALPGRPGVVAALDKLFTPIEVGAPLVIGWAADRFGLVPALALLLLQPLGLLVVALIPAMRTDRPDSMR